MMIEKMYELTEEEILSHRIVRKSTYTCTEEEILSHRIMRKSTYTCTKAMGFRVQTYNQKIPQEKSHRGGGNGGFLAGVHLGAANYRGGSCRCAPG